MIHNLFPNDVRLEPLSHRYYDNSGLEYMGFSKCYEFLVKKFNASQAASNYKNKSKSEGLADWDLTSDTGSRIDSALDRFAQTATILDSDDDLIQLVQCVLKKYEPYDKTYEQVVVYHKGFRVAGSLDKLGIVSNRSDSRFHLPDFKCFEKGYDSLFTISGDRWLKAPFEHLPNNKYTKISFQTSFYAYLLEELTGRKCERLFIDLITPVTEKGRVISFTNQVVPVNYLKNDVKLFLEYYKDDIKDMLDKTENAVYENNDGEIF